ncbi:MAG: hypothetical protein IKX66_02920 [Clostridia bacterium]|nr:hypothetical protein [Clostridia bacterium]
MGRVVFNCLIIAVSVISVPILGFLISSEYKKSVTKGWKVIRAICLVLCLAFVVLAVLSLDWNGKPILTGELKEVRTRGSFRSVWDRYVIVIIADDGKEYSVESIPPVNGFLMDGVDDLPLGARYEVYGSTVHRGFFYAISPVSE